MSHEDIYREGIAEAMAKPENNRYAHVLSGLAKVLASEDCLVSTRELSSLFHYPLATWDVNLPFQQLVQILAAETLPGELTYNEQQVLKPRMDIHIPYMSPDELSTEAAIDRRQRDIRQRAVVLAGSMDTYAKPSIADHRQRAEIVEALLGPVEAVIKARARADDLEHGAAKVNARMEEEIAQLGALLADLPAVRARSMQPLAALKFKPTVFKGNVAPVDCSLLGDRAAIVRKEAIVQQRRVAKLVATVPPPDQVIYSEDTVTRIYTKAISATDPRLDGLEMLGWFYSDPFHVLACANADDVLVYFDADKMRWLYSLTKFDEILGRVKRDRVSGTRCLRAAAVLLRDGVDVAVAMPLCMTGITLPLDVEEARRTMAAHRAGQPGSLK